MAETLSLGLHDEAPPEGAPLLTIPGGIGLYRGRTSLKLEAVLGDGFTADIRFERCFVRLGSNGDLFLDLLVPGAQDSHTFDLGIQWHSQRGVSFEGGSALEITIPLRAKLPFVKLQALHAIARPQAGATATVAIELSADASASVMGVAEASIERIGVIADLIISGPRPAGAIPLGPVAATVRFKPPTGAGLSLDIAGVLKGGGALSIDPDKGQYSGVVSVNLFGIGVTAIILINTKPVFALLAVVTANFAPVGLDIGFGFTINRVGGMVGLNRGSDTNAISQGLRTNALASVLFPANPVAEAPRVVNDLARFFPPVTDQFLVGPMFELGWGKPTGMFTLALGVVIEVPDPKITLLGIFRVLVPPGIESPPLRIQVNFAGGVDFARRMLWFDASLYDSRLITYTLEGDMAARLRWGANATFAVTVGGWHPKYTPPSDLGLPPTRRVTINLLPTDDNPRLRIESYYAATSNTLQHGARLEVYATAAGCGLRGFLGYDVLVQVSPLHFEANFEGSVTVMAFGEDIMNMNLRLSLSGPNPWRVSGEVSFKILIKRFTVPVRATFGSDQAPAVPAIDVAKVFRDHVAQPRNWSATLPEQGQLLVVLRRRIEIATDEVLAHPSATIQFEQRALPLAVTIQRFGAAKPADVNFFNVVGMSAGVDLVADPLESEFAPAQFFDLTEDQKMSAPSFRNEKSGLRANGAALVRFEEATAREFRYEDKAIDPEGADSIFVAGLRDLTGITVEHALTALDASAIAFSDIYRERVTALPTGDEIKVSPGSFVVVDAKTMAPVTTTAEAVSHVAAEQLRSSMIAADPALTGRLTVMSAFEVG
jgi:hypothetical protein